MNLEVELVSSSQLHSPLHIDTSLSFSSFAVSSSYMPPLSLPSRPKKPLNRDDFWELSLPNHTVFPFQVPNDGRCYEPFLLVSDEESFEFYKGEMGVLAGSMDALQVVFRFFKEAAEMEDYFYRFNRVMVTRKSNNTEKVVVTSPCGNWPIIKEDSVTYDVRGRKLMSPTSENTRLVDFSYGSSSNDDSYEIEAEQEARFGFLIKVCNICFTAGEPSHRLQNNLILAAKALNVNFTCTTTSTNVVMTFGETESNIHRRSHTFAGAIKMDLQKLYLMHEVIENLVDKLISFENAVLKITEIDQLELTFPWWMRIIGCMLCAFAKALILVNGSFRDAGIAGALGLFVGAMEYAGTTYFPVLARLNPFLSSAVCAFAAATIPNTCFIASSLPAASWMVPGLSLTYAVLEISNKSYVAGIARFVYAFLQALLVGYGIATGARISGFEPHVVPCTDGSVFEWYTPFIVVILCFSYIIKLNAGRFQWMGVLLICSFGFACSRIGQYVFYFDIQTTDVLSSFVIGLIANLFARFYKQPALIYIICGVLTLLPGSTAAKSVLAAITSGGSVSGAAFALQVMLIAVSVTIGITLANFVVFPTREVHHRHT